MTLKTGVCNRESPVRGKIDSDITYASRDARDDTLDDEGSVDKKATATASARSLVPP